MGTRRLGNNKHDNWDNENKNKIENSEMVRWEIQNDKDNETIFPTVMSYLDSSMPKSYQELE